MKRILISLSLVALVVHSFAAGHLVGITSNSLVVIDPNNLTQVAVIGTFTLPSPIEVFYQLTYHRGSSRLYSFGVAKNGTLVTNQYLLAFDPATASATVTASLDASWPTVGAGPITQGYEALEYVDSIGDMVATRFSRSFVSSDHVRLRADGSTAFLVSNHIDNDSSVYDSTRDIYYNGDANDSRQINRVSLSSGDRQFVGAFAYSDMAFSTADDAIYALGNPDRSTLRRIRTTNGGAPITTTLLGSIPGHRVLGIAYITLTPPQVELTSPGDGSNFGVGSDIFTTALANDLDDGVANVQFLANGTLIGVATNSPYSLVWTNAPLGSHLLKAVATDFGGLMATSGPVSISVSDPCSVVVTNLLRNPSFENVTNVEIVRDQGFLPDDWSQIGSFFPNADTFSNDGSFGLRPTDGFDGPIFPGVQAADGIRWVASASWIPERFGQRLSMPLIPDQKYTLTADLIGSSRPDVASPGAYRVYLANDQQFQETIYLGELSPTVTNRGSWQSVSLTFTAPIEAHERPFLVFEPVAEPTSNGALLSYLGMDLIRLVPECPTLCYRMCPGPVAWWRAEGDGKNEVSGTFGELVNETSFAPGLVGQAFQFDGVDDIVRIANADAPSFPSGAAITTELWVKRTSDSFPQHFFGKRVGCTASQTEWNYMDAVGDGALSFIDIPLNQWVHVAAVFDGTNFIRYLNGQLLFSVLYQLPPANSADLLIGSAGDCTPFGGLIDEFAIYNRALGPEEIRGIYEARGAGKCVVPLACSNRPPTLDLIDNMQLSWNSPQQTVTLSGITSGSPNEFQRLTVTARSSNPDLIPDPIVVYVSPNATGFLTFEPTAGELGTTQITVTVQDDGGTANGGPGTISRTFTVAVVRRNEPPLVTLTSPDDGATFLGHESISLSADAHDPDGNVVKVEFFSGTNRIGAGVLADQFYQVEWTNAPSATHMLRALVTDDGGATAWSAALSITVRVRVGDILIIRNLREPNGDDHLKEYLEAHPPKVPDIEGDDLRDAIIVEADHDAVTFDQAASFRLVIWKRRAGGGVLESDVALLQKLSSYGMPLYLIGENLASDLQRLSPESKTDWSALIGLQSASGFVGPGTVELLPPVERPEELFRGPAGEVKTFWYPNPLRRTLLIGDGEVRAELATSPVLVRFPAEGAFIDQARQLTQNFRVGSGDAHSTEERRKLFLNGVFWLLGRDCDAFAVTLDRDPEIVEAPRTGHCLVLTNFIGHSGECTARAVIAKHEIASGLQVIGARVVMDNEPYTNAVTAQVGRTVYFNLGAIPKSKRVDLETVVIALESGSYTNRVAARAAGRGWTDWSDSTIEVAGEACRPLNLSIKSSPEGPVLDVDPGGFTCVVLEWSTNLLRGVWKATSWSSTEGKVDRVLAQSLVSEETGTNFFRLKYAPW